MPSGCRHVTVMQMDLTAFADWTEEELQVGGRGSHWHASRGIIMGVTGQGGHDDHMMRGCGLLTWGCCSSWRPNPPPAVADATAVSCHVGQAFFNSRDLDDVDTPAVASIAEVNVTWALPSARRRLLRKEAELPPAVDYRCVRRPYMQGACWLPWCSRLPRVGGSWLGEVHAGLLAAWLSTSGMIAHLPFGLRWCRCCSWWWGVAGMRIRTRWARWPSRPSR